jgi:hypothetical protein
MSMPHYAAYDRREDYPRIREVMEDGARFPAEFDVWESTAKRQLSEVRQQGINLQPITIDPEEFRAFCADKGIAPNSAACAKFMVTRAIE